MKICITQTKPLKENVSVNIEAQRKKPLIAPTKKAGFGCADFLFVFQKQFYGKRKN
jgi:hypothetical protein